MVHERLGGRRSIRLPEYDYSQNGTYFVTICTRNHKTYFERYEELKKIVEKEWLYIPKRFRNVQLDEYVVMPNHLHGIIIIVGATLAVAQNQRARASFAPTSTDRSESPTIGQIIGAFKSSCANAWLKYVERHRRDAPVRI
jgi:REP-associated tyrosine transposase